MKVLAVGLILRSEDFRDRTDLIGVYMKLNKATMLCDCNKGEVFTVINKGAFRLTEIRSKKSKKTYYTHINDVYEVTALPTKGVK